MPKIFWFFLLFPILLFSNVQIDSLKIDLEKSSGLDRIDILLQIAEKYRKLDNEKCFSYGKQALELAEQNKNDPKKISAELDLSESYLTFGDYLKAHNSLKRAIELAEKNNYQWLIVQANIQLSSFYSELKHFQIANEILKKALAFADRLFMKEDIAQIYLLIGKNYRQAEEYKSAKANFEKALEMYQYLKNYSKQAVCLLSLGKVYMSTGEHRKSIEYEQQSLLFSIKSDDSWLKSLAYNDIGWNYFKLGDFEQALQYNQKAFSIRDTFENKINAVSSYINIGALYREWGKTAQAITYLEKGLGSELKTNSLQKKILRRNAFKLLYEIYLAENDYRKSLKYHQQYVAMKDSLNSIINDQKLNEIYWQLELEKQKREQGKQRVKQRNKLIKRDILLSFGGLCIIFLSIIIFIFRNRYKLRNKKNKELENINKQLNEEISQRKNTEDRLSAKQQHLKLINKILRHDLSNDITVIQSGLKLYSELKDESILKEVFDKTQKSIGLIREMREFENFMTEFKDLKIFSLKEVTDEIKPEYNSLQIDLKGDVKFMADNSVHSVIDNIIHNALTHGKASKIEVEGYYQKNDCIVQIKNNGEDIPAKIKSKIFNEGFKFGESSKTGMGLFIAKKAMHKFGGYIAVADNQPQGAVFILHFRKSIQG